MHALTSRTTFFYMHSLPGVAQAERLRVAGGRFGAKGTHSTRTMMLAELTELLRAVPRGSDRTAYESAILEDNVLGKATASNRRLSLQRLTELYGVDSRVPLFVVLRRLWELDPAGRPLLALLVSLARDPLLRATADYVLELPEGAEVSTVEFLASIRDHVEARLNDAILDKVRRNVGASWTQSGHLNGRVRKIRRLVAATTGPVAMALWLGSLEGRVGEELLSSFWMRTLDAPRHRVLDLTLRLKPLGIVNASVGGGVVQIDPSPLLAASTSGGV